jgi:UDP-N-acetylglucosamine 2-epimerase (non-hydrolysing)
MKVHFLFGTKAELIKSAGILMEMSKRRIPYGIIHTGQHACVDEELKTFNLPKLEYRITIRKKNLSTVSEMAYWWLFKGLKNGLKKNVLKKGDLVLVHGDTESTLLAALIAKIKGCKLAHIEGGLRSGDIKDPFPEEIVRRIVDNVSDYVFAPNEWALSNLKGLRSKTEVINTFLNPSYDSLRFILKKKSVIEIPKGKFAIILFHRKENIYIRDNLVKSFKIIEEVVKRFKSVMILAKNTEHVLKQNGYYEKLRKNRNVIFSDYYNFIDFVHLVNASEFLISDGGSIQEETYLMNKPVLLLRKKTERIEGLNQTACLSKLNFDKALDFLDNYKNLKRSKYLSEKSPSHIICDKVQEIIKWKKNH